MKIVGLHVENIKRIKTVDIVPDPQGNLVIISGMNEQGKTTTLDSIWWALGGAKDIQSVPLRKGADKGKIVLDLGEIVATRKFTAKGSTIEVTNKDGMVFKSPQAVLDKLISKVSFDVEQFICSKPAEQAEILLSLVDIPVSIARLQELSGLTTVKGANNPLETLQNVYKEVYSERTLVNRDMDKAKKVLESMPEVEAKEAVSIVELLNEKEVLVQHNTQVDEEKAKIDTIKAVEDEIREEIAYIDELEKSYLKQIAELQKKIKALSAEKSEAANRLIKNSKDLAAQKQFVSTLEVHDLTEINEKIANADKTNQQAQEYAKRQEQVEVVKEQIEQAEGLTAKLLALKDYKNELMQQVKFPIDGLDFAAGGVSYQGVPFEQASGSQKLQVSMAIAMAQNPNLKVIRFNDANRLDSKQMEVVRQMAEKHDFQVWMEYVDETGKVGIVIEDGMVIKAKKEGV